MQVLRLRARPIRKERGWKKEPASAPLRMTKVEDLNGAAKAAPLQNLAKTEEAP